MVQAFKWLSILVVIAIAVCAGLIRAYPTGNTPRTYNLLIETKEPRGLSVEVLSDRTLAFAVDDAGRVALQVPSLPRTCSWQWFGLKIVDGSPKTRKLIRVVRNGTAVRRLSIAQLEGIQPSPDGTIKLRL